MSLGIKRRYSVVLLNRNRFRSHKHNRKSKERKKEEEKKSRYQKMDNVSGPEKAKDKFCTRRIPNAEP